MISPQLLRSYELLTDRAESTFRKVKEKHGECISCMPHCADCCHAVFGLFLIEAAYINIHFNQLDIRIREEVISRCEQADKDLLRLERIMHTFKDDPRMMNYSIARERVRCPLLNDDDECELYIHRPITCRVYGIPTSIHGKTRVCGKSKFIAGKTYPIYYLDGTYRELHGLSLELLSDFGSEEIEKASLLFSVSKVLRTPIDNLISDNFEEQNIDD